ncbi:MAG TPA: hypothetical protein VHW66_10365 [Stellaceae bacterium]|jgi:hypothetical protein|nr:hypothetical protein [Stellaceae bacterium]
MKGLSAYLAAMLLVTAPAAAQTAPGTLGGGQVGSGAVELPNLPQSGAALAPASPTSASNSGTAVATGSGSAGGSGSSGGGGSGAGGVQTPCLSANGTVRDAIADEFALSCNQ